MSNNFESNIIIVFCSLTNSLASRLLNNKNNGTKSVNNNNNNNSNNSKNVHKRTDSNDSLTKNAKFFNELNRLFILGKQYQKPIGINLK